MKHSGKTTLLVTALLAISSCNRFDRTTPLGPDVFGGLDSSAIKYDGTFYTDPHIPTASELVSITDKYSGMHRYEDSLARSGGIQTEIVIGKFYDQESFGSVVFLPKVISDTLDDKSVQSDTTIRSPRYYVDSLLKAGHDSVSTALTFTINNRKQTESFYNIELSTGPYTKDSVKLDTTKLQVMQNVLIPGNVSKHTVSLPYHFYRAKENDVVTLNRVNGVIISPRVDTITTITRTWKKGSETYSDDTVSTKTKTYIDTMTFLESEIRKQSIFTGVTSDAISKTTDMENYSYEIFTRGRTENGKDVVDTVRHTWKVMADSTYDKITFTRPVTVETDTAKAFPVGKAEVADSVYTFTRTATKYKCDTVIQQSKEYSQTVKFSRSTYNKDNHDSALFDMLDTLTIIMKNISNDNNSMFHVLDVSLKIFGSNDSSSGVVLGNKRKTMQVFNGGTALSSTDPVMDGGLERFVRLKVNTLPFWKMMNSQKYMNIVQGTLQIPVDKSKTRVPEYKDSTLDVRYYMHSELQTNGQLLATSARSKAASYNQDSTYLKIDITDFLVDQYYDGSSPTPDSYLYLWIDGADMGRLAIDRTKEYLFTYIVQNKQ